VWSFLRADLHGPGLAALGLHPDRLILVHARNEAEVLTVLEESLRTPKLAAALGEVGRLSLTASRRLQLACERSGATGFILKRRAYGEPCAEARRDASAAVTRWRITSLPSAGESPGLGGPRFEAALIHCRGGRPGRFIMELSHGSPGSVHLVAELADREAEASQASTRAAG
jgi:protein ImuA